MLPESTTHGSARLRSAGDQLAGGVAKAGFRRRAAVKNAPDGGALVARAVARAKEGDPEAIRYLYLRYSDNVYSYVRAIVRDDHEAEDITQHVFAKLITSISKYEQRSVPFAGWILATGPQCGHRPPARQQPDDAGRGDLRRGRANP